MFIAGLYPYWVFMTSRGTLRCHPMNVDGHVTSFVPFHNINCRNGFLYFNNKVCIFSNVYYLMFSICKNTTSKDVHSVILPGCLLSLLWKSKKKSKKNVDKKFQFFWIFLEKKRPDVKLPINRPNFLQS